MDKPPGARAWDAAIGLIGTPFRLHGRDPATGLDCVGLVVAAYSRAGQAIADVPDRYRLCGPDQVAAERWLRAAGALPAVAVVRAGDIALAQMGDAQRPQLHLMLMGTVGAVHAHAGLRRVVFSPLPLPGVLISRWRLETGE